MSIDLRHLDVLLAISETGSFTAAAERLFTVQSNVSEQVRQVETELGVPLFVRGRRGAAPTEFGEVVLRRARHIRREVAALRDDVSMLLELETGHASLGVVGTASPWLVPQLVGELRRRAPGIQLKIEEGPSERLAREVLDDELSVAVITSQYASDKLTKQDILEEAFVAVVASDVEVPEPPIPVAWFATQQLALPPSGNPVRREVEVAARNQGVTVSVPIEVEGVRLITDIVRSGRAVTILPQTAAPRGEEGVRTFAISGMPPRRLALVRRRGAHLSIADQTVWDVAVGIMERAVEELGAEALTDEVDAELLAPGGTEQ
ncbi:MAG: LysR family transcriptional regulator [Acidimicrobiia bacterium]|jgi:DNA-binding transcriptional LysR family regulator|nr:LysR family transcriptional regulator [Acidimicrobiia bacterium]MBP8181647.1 LysR family transcriptional regulator [Acidimicrobiia bacterium]